MSSESARPKADAGDDRVEAFTPTQTAVMKDVVNFRCLPQNKHLKDELFGRTLLERWNSTYPARGSLQTFTSMYKLKLRVLSMYVRQCGGATFAAFAFVMLGTSWIVCSGIVTLGMIGFIVMTTVVGLGEYGCQAVDLMTALYRYFVGDEGQTSHLPGIFGGIWAYRMTYYTLPMTYFAYEELRFLVRRVVRLMRWVV
jgi:hypothetical protein